MKKVIITCVSAKLVYNIINKDVGTPLFDFNLFNIDTRAGTFSYKKYELHDKIY